MRSKQFIKKIRDYSLIAFLLPLITINSCLLMFKFHGDFNYYPGLNWNEKEIEYAFDEYLSISSNIESRTFTNCPRYEYITYYISTDNQSIPDLPEYFSVIENLEKNNKIKSVAIKQGETKNNRCVKNNRFLYLLLNNFKLEKIFLIAVEKNTSGFAKIENPYFYGEVSISRTARYLPSILIFKPLIILSAIFLFLYWKNNLSVFNKLENKNFLTKSSKKFFYFGILSCIFLILHASFLGLDIDSKLFAKMRKLIIILFIFFEILAQIFLTKNLLEFKEELKKYIRPFIIKIKVAFVTIILLITCIVLALLVWGDLNTSSKHVIEWNYFSTLLFYYFLSRLLWK